MTEQEKSLLAGCLRQDKAAWDAFVLQYSSLVYHAIKSTFSLYHTEPRGDLVEDLYQEFFLSILRDGCKKLGQFRGDRGCSLASWLRVIAARLTVDFLRRLRTEVEVADAISSVEDDPTDSLVSEEQKSLLNEALQDLASRERILIDLFYRQGLLAEEIAVMLKTSVGAVYTQKSRILDRVRAALRK